MEDKLKDALTYRMLVASIRVPAGAAAVLALATFAGVGGPSAWLLPMAMGAGATALAQLFRAAALVRRTESKTLPSQWTLLMVLFAVSLTYFAGYCIISAFGMDPSSCSAFLSLLAALALLQLEMGCPGAILQWEPVSGQGAFWGAFRRFRQRLLVSVSRSLWLAFLATAASMSIGSLNDFPVHPPPVDPYAAPGAPIYGVPGVGESQYARAPEIRNVDVFGTFFGTAPGIPTLCTDKGCGRRAEPYSTKLRELSISEQALALFKTAVIVFLLGTFQAFEIQACTVPKDGVWPSVEDLRCALKQPFDSTQKGLGRWAALATLAQAAAHRQAAGGVHTGSKGTLSGRLPLADQVFYPAGASQGVGNGHLVPSFFSLYLKCALETIQEFNLRCLTLHRATTTCVGPAELSLDRYNRLCCKIANIKPLATVAAAGLSSWVCLSRDLDVHGVVQKEGALEKMIYEYSAALDAIRRCDSAAKVQEVLASEDRCRVALLEMQLELKRGMEQLLVVFEDAGLGLIWAAPKYQAIAEAFTK